MLTSLQKFNVEAPGAEFPGPVSNFGFDLGSADIEAAADRIRPYVRRTPMVRDAALSERFNSNIYLKLELLQHTGAFKVRGAFNKLLTLGHGQLGLGVVAVSAGNHAQAVAFASRALRIKALILMPRDTPKNYLVETKRYGADVRLYPTMADAFEAAKGYETRGWAYVHPFDDPLVIAGQGTIGLEILEEVPEVTDVIVSIGGGGLSAGVAAAIKAEKPDTKIWGVETRGAHSMAAAFEAGKVVELARPASIARTLCAPAAGKLTFAMAQRHLESVTVVDDSEAVAALFFLLERSKVLTEPASSCTLAAADRLKAHFDPQSNVVLILCGGNVGLTDLFELRPV